MEGSSTGNSLDSPQHIKTIVEKLPYKMRDRFRRLAYDMQGSNRLTAFETILDFLNKEVEIIRMPLFGDIAGTSSLKSSSSKQQNKILATTADRDVSRESSRCACCRKSNHSIDYCFFFKECFDTGCSMFFF